jgi:hypothetical protein
VQGEAFGDLVGILAISVKPEADEIERIGGDVRDRRAVGRVVPRGE